MRYLTLLDSLLRRKPSRGERIVQGFRSLGSFLDSRTIMDNYLKGNNVSDIQSDWQAVGNDLRLVLNFLIVFCMGDNHKMQENNSGEKKAGKCAKYTKEAILSMIKENNLITTSDLRKFNEYAWKKARDNGWTSELGLIKSKHEDGYWTKDRVYSVAKKYTNKNEFKSHEPTAYKWASNYDLLDKLVWMKCPTYDDRREAHDSVVYAFVDEKNKVAYVGLTIDEKSRVKSHRNSKNSAVRKYFGKNIPNPIVLSND